MLREAAEVAFPQESDVCLFILSTNVKHLFCVKHLVRCWDLMKHDRGDYAPRSWGSSGRATDDILGSLISLERILLAEA